MFKFSNKWSLGDLLVTGLARQLIRRAETLLKVYMPVFPLETMKNLAGSEVEIWPEDIPVDDGKKKPSPEGIFRKHLQNCNLAQERPNLSEVGVRVGGEWGGGRKSLKLN